MKKQKQRKPALGRYGDYHIADIHKAFYGCSPDVSLNGFPLPTHPTKPHCYSAEFQDWFADGLRFCEKHDTPVRWHIFQRLDCPACERDGA